ncbi:uncharacterized protein LOC143291977 [Babylonia areolata]|uniref:uncharacterized protein LOC143291977 n=1 Tax=Babylonia areolata TaxID=304850 RepID=UPI003FD54874
MACCVLRSLMVAMTIMGTTVMVRGQAVQFTDEQAGRHLDDLNVKGIGLSVKLDLRFRRMLDEVNQTLQTARDMMANEYHPSNLPNVTAIVEEKLVDINQFLDYAEAQLSSSINATSDALIAYMKSPQETVNVGNHYDTATDVFTVPEDGLYQVLTRNLPYDSSFACNVVRDGTTLTTLDVSGYFDIRTRIRLVFLDAGDTIYTTGSTPEYFSVMRLRLQTLMPSFLQE